MKNDETYQTDKFGDLVMLVTGGTNYTMAEEHLLYRKVLRAVVELHKPKDFAIDTDFPWVGCKECERLYPCPTIQAIEEKLK